MAGSSILQLCKKNGSSVKLQDRPSDHSPRKIPAEEEIDEIKTQKLNTQESKEKNFQKL